MTTTDTTRADALVARYTEISSQIATLNGELDQIKEELRTIGNAVTSTGMTISVSPNRRFNADRAAEVLPAPLLAAITRPTIDTTLAKAQLPPALYEACMVEAGKPRVAVK